MISEVCKTIFGISKDDPLGKGILVNIEKSVDAESSLFFKVTFIVVPPVFDKVPAITRDLLLAVKIVVSELLEIATVASEKLFAICYPPKAIAKGIAFGSLSPSIETVDGILIVFAFVASSNKETKAVAL